MQLIRPSLEDYMEARDVAGHVSYFEAAEFGVIVAAACSTTSVYWVDGGL